MQHCQHVHLKDNRPRATGLGRPASAAINSMGVQNRNFFVVNENNKMAKLLTWHD